MESARDAHVEREGAADVVGLDQFLLDADAVAGVRDVKACSTDLRRLPTSLSAPPRCARSPRHGIAFRPSRRRGPMSSARSRAC